MGDKIAVKQVDLYKEQQGIVGNRLTFKSSSPYIPQYVTSSLTASSDPDAIYSNRVQGRQILLENPSRDARKRKEEEEKREKIQERKKARGIGKREAAAKGIWKLDKEQAKYKLFLPLHHLWMSYMSELLSLSPRHETRVPPTEKSVPSSQSMFPKLVKADFHGAIILVCQSKNPCLVGISGIIIHETENAFKIITQSSAIKLLPKQNSIFTLSIPLYSNLPASHTLRVPLPIPDQNAQFGVTVLDLPHFQFELHGNQFRFRSAERAGRKFKHKETIEL